ncbi:hypothetical protein ABEG63_12470 [Chryseobacterium sp. C39-AII1]|uniref:hypothetical protein n=1 Tax=Chryseobacterium sp. C39-AII1 TaxID=3080332 RepID=UPI003209DF78
MKSSSKIWILCTAGVFIYWSLSNKKKVEGQAFTAPDGNFYKKDEIYQTADQMLYKNGKLLRQKIHPRLTVDEINEQENKPSDSLSFTPTDHLDELELMKS